MTVDESAQTHARGSLDGLRWLLVLPPIAVSAAILMLARDPTPAQDPVPFLADSATGVLLAVAGVLLWSRRPGRRSGPLLVLAGYLWYVGSLYEILPAQSLAPYLGFVFRGYYDAIIAFVILAFPTDRLSRRVERVAVAALVGLMVALSVWRLIATPPGFGSGYPRSAPASPLLLVRDINLTLSINVWIGMAIGVVLVLVSLLVLSKLRRLSPGVRSLSAPALIGGAAWAAVAGISMIATFLSIVYEFELLPTDGTWTGLQYAVRMLGPIGILISVSRLHNRSGSVIEIIARPEGAPSGGELQRALREAFDDPILLLAYPNGDQWMGSDGSPIDLDHLPPSRVATMIAPPGSPEVAIVHDEYLLDEPSLMRTLRAVVGLAVDNERLESSLRTQLEEVRASRARIADAADDERKRVERDLHDGAQQRLVALLVSLRTIRSRLGPDIDPSVATELEAASNETRAAIAEVRELAQGLDPAILREAGLAQALRALADRSPVPVVMNVDIRGSVPARVETTAYFVVSEALANVAKHAAAGNVVVSVLVAQGLLRLSITDDGVGGADPQGRGLRGLADRVAAVDGEMAVGKGPTTGTAIEVSIPCAS